MSSLEIDLTGTSEDFPVVEQGVYNGKVTGVALRVKDNGNTVLDIDLVITQKCDFENERLRYFHTYDPQNVARSKRNLVKLYHYLGILTDAEAAGDSSVKLLTSPIYGEDDEYGRKIIKAIKVNDREVPVVGIKCNIVSAPRVDDKTGKRKSWVDGLEPYAAVTARKASKKNPDAPPWM